MCNGALSIVIVHFFFFSVFAVEQELYEGSQCTLEDNIPGLCKKLPDCSIIFQRVKEGKRQSTSAGRCGFVNFTEIVCCPININDKISARPAVAACEQFDVDLTNEKLSNLVFHISGGINAQSGEFPYMVALGYQNKELEKDPSPIKYRCGGSLISPQHVLTAAHCIKTKENILPIEVRLGDENLQSPVDTVQRIPISDIIVHPKYKSTVVYNDVAILKLKTKAQLSKRVKPVCLQTTSVELTSITSSRSFAVNEENMDVTSRIRFVTIGFGALDFGEESSPALMKTYSLDLVGREECNEFYRNLPKLPRGISEGMICAKDSNVTRRSDACVGDSGGPLVMTSQTRDTVIGITSFGYGCSSSAPGIYTSVYSYLDWIEEHVWANNDKETLSEPEDSTGATITKLSITFNK